MVYLWREGTRWRGKAQEIGERIEHIRIAAGGTITPHDVVEEARHEASPLHPVFEWDNQKAADHYRVDQARQLVSDVMVVYAEEVEGASRDPMRAFASVSQDGNATAYTGTLDAMRSPAMRASVLAQAKKELEGWRRRYRHYQELAAAVERVDEALATVA